MVAGGGATTAVVPGTVVTSPMAPVMMTMMPGIAIGILKALFLGGKSV